uniref:Uncharacterized protein n=1 Tax=Anopheles culicifacies TaxID=139723 RepID=A0A182MGS3_9DIPT
MISTFGPSAEPTGLVWSSLSLFAVGFVSVTGVRRFWSGSFVCYKTVELELRVFTIMVPPLIPSTDPGNDPNVMISYSNTPYDHTSEAGVKKPNANDSGAIHRTGNIPFRLKR